MHNPRRKPVDNSPVDNMPFHPQLSLTMGTAAAPVQNKVVKLCTARISWPKDGYPQKVIHLRFISSSEKLFICLFFFFMLSPMRVSDQAPLWHDPGGTVHHKLYME
jgi:hypothetical protein